MKRVFLSFSFLFSFALIANAQEIKVTPSSVTVYSQGATTVFLTFSGLQNKRPAEATWCGALVVATPDLGMTCDPATIFGRLPSRYDQSRLSNNGSYTDIMSVTPAVARRAYLDAVSGAEGTFFYVRHFVSTSGPDEFVPIEIRLSGNGASVPFSLTDVKLLWGVDRPVILVQPGERLPSIKAEIKYTGAGRLRGRWEIVKPGEELPDDRDRLTEGTLPVEERNQQRRYTQLGYFNVYLPPIGKYILPGPERWRMPSHIVGPYQILLRLEATDDTGGNSDLAAIGAGPGTIQTGAVAGFPLPALRYYVGGGTANDLRAEPTANKFASLMPADLSIVPICNPLEFSWTEIPEAALYRLEIEVVQNKTVLSAVLLPGSGVYRAPSWISEKTGNGNLLWRVIAFDSSGKLIGETARRSLRLVSIK